MPSDKSHETLPLPWASVHWLVQCTLECHWLTQCTLEYHWKNLVESAPHWDATGETLTFPAYTGTPCDDRSTLVQVMAWCCPATSRYLRQCWPSSTSPYGGIDLTLTRSIVMKKKIVVPLLIRNTMTEVRQFVGLLLAYFRWVFFDTGCEYFITW